MTYVSRCTCTDLLRESVRALTLRVDRELSIAVAVSEHARGVELPQGAFPTFLRRAGEDLVVVGEAQQAHHFGERQVGAATAHRGESRHGRWFKMQSLSRHSIIGST